MCNTKRTCERLILNGYNLLEADEDSLYVVHVVNEKGKILDNSNYGEALEYLFRVSKEAGADLTVLRSKDVMKTIRDFAREKGITHIVMGTTPGIENNQDMSFGFRLKKSLPDIEVMEI